MVKFDSNNKTCVASNVWQGSLELMSRTLHDTMAKLVVCRGG
jgi:hypothetical protein